MKDLFISHASEDKEELVRPLAAELMKYGVDIWYDEFELLLLFLCLKKWNRDYIFKIKRSTRSSNG